MAGLSRGEALRWTARATVVAGGALATLAARRYAARRAEGTADPLADEPLGALHGPVTEIRTDDGVVLCAEVCEPPAGGEPGRPTLVFVPGFCLHMDAWHFQRRDLRDLGRLVFYDQRGHGRSGRGDSGHATIEQLARDLRRVVDETAPDGPVILVGHSLGGMVLMAFAAAYPELVGGRVVGAALIATSPGKMAEVTLGLPAALTRLLRPYAPGVVGLVAVQPAVVEWGLRADRDVGLLLTRRYSFGPARASPSLVRFTGTMLSSTPMDVFAEFFPEFDRHDKEAALPVFRACQTAIVAGESDLVTPPDHSRAMAAVLPGAELTVVPDAGHMVLLEYPAEVNGALRRLAERVRLAAGVEGAG